MFSDSAVGASEVSLHSPHLMDSRGNLTPSALIPFCGYQTNMTILGNKIQDLPFPICTKFQPILLEGQLCYSLDLTAILEGNTNTKSGKTHGILLILDLGQTNENINDNFEESSYDSLDMEVFNNGETSFKIYIHTLAGFKSYKAGTYVMSSLKKMTGTKSFLALPEETKACQLETFETCQSQRYMEDILEKCGCVPWSLSSAMTQQVSFG